MLPFCIIKNAALLKFSLQNLVIVTLYDEFFCLDLIWKNFRKTSRGDIRLKISLNLKNFSLKKYAKNAHNEKK